MPSNKIHHSEYGYSGHSKTITNERDGSEPPRKVLKLSRHGKNNTDPELHFPESSSAEQQFTLLTQFEGIMPVRLESVHYYANALTDLIRRPTCANIVRVQAIRIICRLALTSDYDASEIIDTLISFMNDLDSEKISSETLNTLLVLSNARSGDNTLKLRLLKISFQKIAGSKHRTQIKCLNIISSLLPTPDDLDLYPYNLENGITPRAIVADFIDNNDARAKWHDRGILIEESMYPIVKKALEDSAIGVRLESLHLIWLMSQLYPDKILKGDKVERICDDGFVQICNCINDSSVKVRAKAARYMGSLENVGFMYLEQTLDKKLMSNLRRKMTAHERDRALYESSDWAAGVRWAQDTPKERVNVDEVQLMDSGSCGAIIHGLEDEFYEVREETVHSLSNLALRCERFAVVAQDFLVDMFNDEIESVRLVSISSLCKIAHLITLKENQLDVIINLLKDSSYEIREALRNMFSSVKLGSKDVLNGIISALLDNMSRYPSDKYSIWQCMKGLGHNQPNHTFIVVNHLLHTHQNYLTNVPNINDPAYVAILIEVFNASEMCPQIMNFYPEHTSSHYNYLRRIYPDLIPKLNIDYSKVEYLRNNDVTESSKKTCMKEFFDQIIQRLKNLHNEKYPLTLMKLCIRDLKRIMKVDKEYYPNADCLCMYLKAELFLQKYLMKMKSSKLNTEANIVENPLIEKVLKLCHAVQNRFQGISIEDRLQIYSLGLRAQTMLLVEVILKCGGLVVNNSCFHYLNLVTKLQRFITINKLRADNFTEEIFMQTDQFESCNPSIYLSVLQKVLVHNAPGTLSLPSLLAKSSATILSPVENNDQVFTYVSGATIGINMVVEITNVKHRNMIRIKVEYADGEIHLIAPRLTDFTEPSTSSTPPNTIRLECRAILNHHQWSDKCLVMLSVVSIDRSIDTFIELDPVTVSRELNSTARACIFDLTSRPIGILVKTRQCKW